MNDQKLDNLLHASNVFAELVDWYYVVGYSRREHQHAMNARRDVIQAMGNLREPYRLRYGFSGDPAPLFYRLGKVTDRLEWCVDVEPTIVRPLPVGILEEQRVIIERLRPALHEANRLWRANRVAA